MKNTFTFFSFLFAMAFMMSCAPKQEMILVETDYGNMKIKLYDTTPGHRDNIKKLAKEGYYDGTLFHRVIPGFMIQGGDEDSKGAGPDQRLGSGGPGYTQPAEIGAYHFKGAIAAARTQNPQKNSSGAQFYIVQGKPVTAQQLQSFASQKNITYSAEDIARYTKDGGAPFLDNEYTVFGEVVEGMEVIDKIASARIGNADRPVEDVKMTVKVVK